MPGVAEAYVYVFLRDAGWVPVGVIAWEERGRLSGSAFRYGRSWLARADAFPLDPLQLPLSAGTLAPPEGFELPNAIRDAGPDRWGRYLLDRHFGRGLSELEYVVAVGPDRPGALAFGDDARSGPKVWTPTGWEARSSAPLCLEVAAGAAEDAVRDEDTERLREYLRYGPSLGGARPKATVIRDGRPWVAKLSVSLDSRDEPRLEYATMTLAREAGLDVPAVDLVAVGERSAYLIARFDRRPDGTPIAMVSGLTATGLHESDWGAWSYHRLVDAVVRRSPRVERDLAELFGRMVFNVLVYNNDDHPRNFAFLKADSQGVERWSLSPLYDVVPAPVHTDTFTLAMAIGVDGKRASLANALSRCERFRLSRGEASDIIARQTEVVARWREHFAACGVSAQDVARVARSFLPRP